MKILRLINILLFGCVIHVILGNWGIGILLIVGIVVTVLDVLKKPPFPIFYLVGDLYNGWVESKEQLELVFKEYKGFLTPSEILDFRSEGEIDINGVIYHIYEERRRKGPSLGENLRKKGIKFQETSEQQNGKVEK